MRKSNLFLIWLSVCGVCFSLMVFHAVVRQKADAPALSRAEAGLAMGGTTAVAFESAGAVVDRIGRLPVAIDLGRATLRTVHGNLAWAFGYNALLLPVAAGALYPWTGLRLSPVLAGAAMSLSSVSVMLHSLRLLGFGARRGQSQAA